MPRSVSRGTTGSVDVVDGIGTLDESGRLRLLGSAVVGAAFAVVLVMLVLSSWHEATTAVLLGIAVPSGLVGAAIGIGLTLREWRSGGGYQQSVVAERWVADQRVPESVPAEVWVPRVQAQADREVTGWGKVVLGVFWAAMTWTSREQQGPVVAALLLGLWIALAAWGGFWVVPRARAARRLLRQGVSTEDRIG